MCRFQKSKKKREKKNSDDINSGDIKTQDIMSGHTTMYLYVAHIAAALQCPFTSVKFDQSDNMNGFEYERFCRFDFQRNYNRRRQLHKDTFNTQYNNNNNSNGSNNEK